jgi:integrase
MSLVFDFVDHNELYSIRNPMDKVTIPASEEEHPTIRLLTPEEVFSLMARLPSPVNIAVLLVAATGVRVSECLGLRWRHVLWRESKISIEQVFRRGEILNRTKTKASKAPVPMCEALATTLNELRQQTEYGKEEDFVFASPTLKGEQPLWGQTMNAQFVKPTAIELGLVVEGGHFGWHRFRHSLSTWANDTTKDITVSQTMLRHAKADMTAIHAWKLRKGVGSPARIHGAVAEDEARFGVNPMTFMSGWHRAEIEPSKEKKPLASGCAVTRC